MSRTLVCALVSLLLLSGCGEVNNPVASDPYTGGTQSVTPVPSGSSGGGGSTPAPPDYSWVGGDAIGEDYSVTFVKGRSVGQVLQSLGGVNRSAGKLDLKGLYDLKDQYVDMTGGEVTLGPSVVWVDSAPGGVVVFGVGGSSSYEHTGDLSRGGAAAAFDTTVNADTYLRVARRGRVLRELDTLIGYSMKGKPLPEEKGLGFGGDGDVFGASWQMLERVTGVRVTEDWFFGGPHPTYVLADDA